VAALGRLFDRLLDTLAAVACAIIAFLFLAIVADVTLRSLGFGAITWVVGVSEYALLYVTALGAPWLLRERGHVAIEVFRSLMPPGLALAAEKLVCLLCLAACLGAVYAGWPAMVEAWGQRDVRSVFLPRGALFTPVLVAFALMAAQFARTLFGRGTIYAGLSFEQESL
jgi:TRAP-type C4-dicarboxylate transport system permease small subunit